jgi:hypothetical protein
MLFTTILACNDDGVSLDLHMEREMLLGVGVDDLHVGGDFGGMLVVNDVQSDGLALDAGAG